MPKTWKLLHAKQQTCLQDKCLIANSYSKNLLARTTMKNYFFESTILSGHNSSDQSKAPLPKPPKPSKGRPQPRNPRTPRNMPPAIFSYLEIKQCLEIKQYPKYRERSLRGRLVFLCLLPFVKFRLLKLLIVGGEETLMIGRADILAFLFGLSLQSLHCQPITAAQCAEVVVVHDAKLSGGNKTSIGLLSTCQISNMLSIVC